MKPELFRQSLIPRTFLAGIDPQLLVRLLLPYQDYLQTCGLDLDDVYGYEFVRSLYVVVNTPSCLPPGLVQDLWIAYPFRSHDGDFEPLNQRIEVFLERRDKKLYPSAETSS